MMKCGLKGAPFLTSHSDSSKYHPHHSPLRQVAKMYKRKLKNVSYPLATHTLRKYLFMEHLL